MQSQRDLEIDVIVEGHCPFCQGDFAVGYIKDKPAVVHTIPMCKTYEMNDCLDYMTKVRKRLES